MSSNNQPSTNQPIAVPANRQERRRQQALAKQGQPQRAAPEWMRHAAGSNQPPLRITRNSQRRR